MWLRCMALRMTTALTSFWLHSSCWAALRSALVSRPKCCTDAVHVLTQVLLGFGQVTQLCQRHVDNVCVWQGHMLGRQLTDAPVPALPPACPCQEHPIAQLIDSAGRLAVPFPAGHVVPISLAGTTLIMLQNCGFVPPLPVRCSFRGPTLRLLLLLLLRSCCPVPPLQGPRAIRWLISFVCCIKAAIFSVVDVESFRCSSAIMFSCPITRSLKGLLKHLGSSMEVQKLGITSPQEVEHKRSDFTDASVFSHDVRHKRSGERTAANTAPSEPSFPATLVRSCE